MNKIFRLFIVLAAFFVSILLVTACTNNDSSPIPVEGTNVTSVSDVAVFRQTALDLEEHCEQIGGCTCFLDGIRTTCAVVFACLDAGFCELARE